MAVYPDSSGNLKLSLKRLEGLQSGPEIDDFLEELSMTVQMEPAWMNESDQGALLKAADKRRQEIQR